MPEKIHKQLAKLSPKERWLVTDLLSRLNAGHLAGLDITKLKGHEDIFRIRKGRLRIIFRQTEGNIKLLGIQRRDDQTYRDY